MQPGNHIHIPKNARKCEGMSPHTTKWPPILGVGVSRDFWIFREQFEGPNSLYWNILYTIRKLLICSCLKWAHMIHLSTYNTSYGQKKSQESKCQLDFWPLKVRDRLKLRAFRGHVTYRWKALIEGYNIILELTSIEGFQYIYASKMVEYPISGILGPTTWEYRKKWHLGVAPMASYKEYYKGEGGSFPQV